MIETMDYHLQKKLFALSSLLIVSMHKQQKYCSSIHLTHPGQMIEDTFHLRKDIRHSQLEDGIATFYYL